MSDDVKPAAVTLRAAAATGVGSLPGTDVWEWCALVRGELPDLPHLPELPMRGPGADMIGRALGLLADVSPDFSAQTSSDGWRFAGPSTSTVPRLMRRAQSWLGEDLDAAQQNWADFEGTFKIQLAGPWTLAASVELPNGARAISDHGARREIVAVWGEAAARHAVEVARRLPRATVLLQLDEPMIPAVLRGSVITQSGWGHLPPVNGVDVEAALASVVAQVAGTGGFVGIHCCGAHPPLDLFRATGARFVSLDFTLPALDEDAIGRALESEVTLLAGLVPTTGAAANVAGTLLPLLNCLKRIGIPPGDAVRKLVVTPTCGLAGAEPEFVRTLYDTAKAAGAALRDESAPQSGTAGRGSR